MANRQIRTVLEGGGFFEGPRWHEGTWWVSDFYRHTVSRVTADGAETVVTEVEHQPSGLGWLPDGSMVVVSMKDHRVLRLADGALSTHADLSEHCAGHLNDLVVTEQGHVFVGDFGFDLMGGADAATATLKRIDPDGTVTVVADGLQFPNGSVITPDGGTLIVGETFGNRYTAWDLAPDGVVVDEVAAPSGLGVFACMLGGEDGRTLLMCCAPDFYEHNRAPVREAVLVATEVDVPHAGRP
jgi:sugar lactone lactonase YvrE